MAGELSAHREVQKSSGCKSGFQRACPNIRHQSSQTGSKLPTTAVDQAADLSGFKFDSSIVNSLLGSSLPPWHKGKLFQHGSFLGRSTSKTTMTAPMQQDCVQASLPPKGVPLGANLSADGSNMCTKTERLWNGQWFPQSHVYFACSQVSKTGLACPLNLSGACLLTIKGRSVHKGHAKA